MNKENTQRLLTEFPELYGGYYKEPTETAMCWGFECGDGWFDLIYKLSMDIKKHCDLKGSTIPTVFQVKEKFGGLRYYVSSSDDTIRDLIDKAEAESYKTCDICSLLGKPSGQGWIRTRCERHVEKYTPPISKDKDEG